MEFKELVKLEKVFEKYLTYNGINLWKLSETGMYENFLKFPKKKSFLDKRKDTLLRYFVKNKNNKKENEKTEEIGKKREILMIVYGISPINTFKPIIEKLRNKIKIIRYDPPSEETTKEFLEKNKIDYSNVDNYIDEEIKTELKKAEKWLNIQWKKIKEDNKLKNQLGENYIYVIEALEYFCNTRKSYLEIIRLIELYKRIYDIEKPKRVIISDDANAYGRTAVLVARQKGIKTICIQHGQLHGNVIVSDGADKIIVNGFQDKKYLISQRVNKSKIIVTGQIRFDEMPAKMKLNKEEICRKFGLNSNKKIIVYSYQKPVSGENIIESAISCFLENEGEIDREKYEVAITMRPDTPIKNLDIKKRNIKLLIGANIQELAVCSEILITAFSTAAIEFVLMRKPIIAINIGSKPDEYIDYTKLGVGFKITKKEDFPLALKTCLENKKFKEKFDKAREKFIKDYNYKMDGKALERVINILDK